MKQITSTIEPRFIKELKNAHTDSITQPMHQVLTFLITRYGNVDSRRLKQEEDKVRNFSWNIIDPPVVIFNLIEDLEIIAEAAMNAKSDTQLVNYGLDLIRDTGEFETLLLTWYNRPVNDQTWVNFKTHFTTAHRELSKVRGASMRGSAFQQANATVEALTSEMLSIWNELVDSINSLSTVTPPTEIVPPTLPPTIEETNQQMNASTRQQDIIDAIKQLQQQMITLNTNHGSNNNNYNNGNNGGTGARRTGGRYSRTNTSKYCWSHGGCAHSSSECNAKKEGHKNNATFDNKMGGSTSFCGTRDT